MTYEISKDGKSIKCLNCGMTSHNPIDVRDKYCGNCCAYHYLEGDNDTDIRNPQIPHKT